MKAIMVMFDSLNRHMLPPYGSTDVIAPNFQRLAKHTVTFDRCYAGSLPCMPARRELHTGRYNFLHRSWGPLEHYDDSMPELLKKSGVYTHLVSDHWHYWEEGGANYHLKYNSFEWTRGQEGDPWKGRVRWEIPPHIDGRNDDCGRQEFVNRYYMREEKEQSIAVNFANGLQFIEENHQENNWFLQLETFDPHEPFFTPEAYKALYQDHYDGPIFDWPSYHTVRETPEAQQHCINRYKALVTMCDVYLGCVLDAMDRYNLWEDTLLIVNTDHGFLLTEHNWWGKITMPYYNEIAHTPLFIWDPRLGLKGERRSALVQTIDLAPTLLSFFGQPIPADMQGKPLYGVMQTDMPVREYALFGQHGAHVNITDGRYVYMRAPVAGHEHDLFNYVQIPTSYPGAIGPEEMQTAVMHDGFSFTKNSPVMKIQGGYGIRGMEFPPGYFVEAGHLLFNLQKDPKQLEPVTDMGVEERMAEALVCQMRQNDAPAEQYVRLGL